MCTYVGHWNLTTDILHNLRNAERIPFSIYLLSLNYTSFIRVSLNISCLFLAKSSHDIVESSRYIPRDRDRNRFEFGRHYESKKDWQR